MSGVMGLLAARRGIPTALLLVLTMVFSLAGFGAAGAAAPAQEGPPGITIQKVVHEKDLEGHGDTEFDFYTKPIQMGPADEDGWEFLDALKHGDSVLIAHDEEGRGYSPIAVREDVPEGWQVSIACDEEHEQVEIREEEGAVYFHFYSDFDEHLTCTFYNELRPGLIIEKQVDGDLDEYGDTEFTFTAESDVFQTENENEFQLKHGEIHKIYYDEMDFQWPFIVTELDPGDGWETAIECVEVDPEYFYEYSVGEEDRSVTLEYVGEMGADLWCTFTNTPPQPEEPDVPEYPDLPDPPADPDPEPDPEPVEPEEPAPEPKDPADPIEPEEPVEPEQPEPEPDLPKTGGSYLLYILLGTGAVGMGGAGFAALRMARKD